MLDTKPTVAEVTRDLLIRYDKPGPRYTSYPTAPEWRPDFRDAQYRQALAKAAETADAPLAMYVHIPFCQRRCAYCGCNVIVCHETGAAGAYLDHVSREIAMAADALGKRRSVKQLHWGGGTPTFLSVAELKRLFAAITDQFVLDPDAEIAIEVDPRITTTEQIQTLRSLGFNRISMGVQDLDQDVQREIDRRQTVKQTLRLFELCRAEGFQGINMDLIYGLPAQKGDTWAKTIETITTMRPDRLAVYSYAYLPDKVPNQQRINAALLPTGPQKYELFAAARRMFIEAGYRAIGMDHFALPTDELAVAMDERRLHRNFMGYTVVHAPDMIAFGTSAIGEIGGCYAQNEKDLEVYYREIDEGRFPVACGTVLSHDDEVRRWVIRQLMCNFYLDTQELARRFGVTYEEYFADEHQRLQEFLAEDFLTQEDGNLRVLPLGQAFIRNIAMVFDAYIRRPEGHHQFSRTV